MAVTDAPLPRWRRWLDPLAGEPSEVVERVEALRLDRNVTRMRGITPAMTLLQLVAMVATWGMAVDRPELETYARLANYPHFASFPLGMVIVWISWGQGALAKRLQPHLAAIGIVYGSIVGVGLALAGQWDTGGTSDLVLASIGVALILHAGSRSTYLPLVTSLLPLFVLLPFTPGDRASTINAMLNGTTAVTLEVLAFRLTHGALVREAKARIALVGSEARLAALNAQLEQRVEAQVGQLRSYTSEVERLNAALQLRVRDSALALASAMARLGERGVSTEVVGAGTVLDERFELRRQIGSGAMGVVWEGYDKELDTLVAVKLLDRAIARDPDHVQRFLREALAAASVSHPAIVRTEHVAWSTSGQLFQIQELVRGASLDALIAPDRSLPEAEVAALLEVLCDALAAAHARGVTHRDVKPSNVMVSPEASRVFLLDFGIAKLREGGPSSFDQTRSGVVVGTPAYLAPEGAIDAAAVGPATDVYAIGVLAYRLLSGRVPFDREGLTALLAAHALEPVPELTGVGRPMAALVRSMLAKSPSERPTAADVGGALHAIANGRTAGDAIALLRAASVTDVRLEPTKKERV